MKKAKEHHVELVEAREDAAKEPFDVVAASIQGAVVFPRLDGVAGRRHDRDSAKIKGQLAGCGAGGSGNGPRPASSSRPCAAS